jgi:hypothetical protein
VHRSVWLAGIALAVMAAACDGSGQATPDAILGVWEGTLEAERAAGPTELCIDITEAGAGNQGGGTSVSGELYLDGELAGLLAGVLGPDGLLTLGGSSQIGVYSGELKDDTQAAGTWLLTSPEVTPAFGRWSAAKTDRESCH